MTFIIRRARHSDAQGIIDVHIRSIREICSKDYTDSQIEAWAGRKFKPELWAQTMDRDFVWVVESEGLIYGFGQLAIMDEDHGEIQGLYFVPEVTGNGLGKKMFSEILKTSRDHHLKKLRLYSTITAKTFYEALGFLQNESDTTIDMRGVAIPCYPMELKL